MLALLTVLAAVMVPAAIALACNPQAYLRLDPTTVPPGGTLNVSGAFFKPNVSLTITIEGGSSTSVTTSGNGSFSTTMAAPSAAGSYTVSAVGFEPDGSVTNGLPARASFSVAASGAQSGGPGTAPQSGSTAGSGTSQSPAAPPSSGRFAEPEVPSTRAFDTPGSRSRGGAAAGGGGSADAGAGAVNAGAGVVDNAAGPVFAGSVAREDRSPAGAAAAATRGRAPSERTAGSDIWAGFERAGAPSLAADAGGSAPSGGAGSQLGWGLGLLALGLLALVAGLGVSEARRRRSAAAS